MLWHEAINGNHQAEVLHVVLIGRLHVREICSLSHNTPGIALGMRKQQKSFNQWEAPTLSHAVFIGIKASCYRALQVDCPGTSNKRQLIQVQ